MNNNTCRGAIGELQKIDAKEGVLALWKGVAGALTASQLATYDEFKQENHQRAPSCESWIKHVNQGIRETLGRALPNSVKRKRRTENPLWISVRVLREKGAPKLVR
ncbi:hypothetical protein Tco_0897533 [Tanacetum coccineum]